MQVFRELLRTNSSENVISPLPDYFFSLTGSYIDYRSLEWKKQKIDIDLINKINSFISVPFLVHKERSSHTVQKFSVLKIISFIKSYNYSVGEGHKIKWVNLISKQSIKKLPVEDEKKLDEISMDLEIHAFIHGSKLFSFGEEILKRFNHMVSEQICSEKNLTGERCINLENQTFSIVQFKTSTYSDDLEGKANKTVTLIFGDPERLRYKKQDGEFCFGLKID